MLKILKTSQKLIYSHLAYSYVHPEDKGTPYRNSI